MCFKRNIFAVAVIFSLLGAAVAQAVALSPIPEPEQVIVSPQSARVQGVVTLPVQQRGGQAVLLLTLPQDVREIAVHLGKAQAKALKVWSTEPVPMPAATGSNAKARAALQEECDMLAGQIQALAAQMALLSTPPTAATEPAFMEQRMRGIREILPALVAEKAQKERQWEALQQRLAALPDTARRATLVVMDVPTLAVGTSVDVNYAYTLGQSGWTPVYNFNAEPAQESVHVTMLADVWQHSGVDWNKTRIVLSTRQSGQREPWPLSPWLAQKGRPQARAMRAEAARAVPMSLMATAADNTAPAPDGPAQSPETFETSGLYGWTLGQGLPEGRSRLPVLEDRWKTPLQRLARPSVGGQVWLTARQDMQGKNLPAGEAVYLLEGSAVGSGRFAVKDGEATLYFGADPLVTVQTTPDTRMTGETGLVGKRQTWQWGWDYLVRNQRQQPVTVRLEEPAPQAGDKDITVASEDKPAPQKGKDNSIYWDVAVPAQGTAAVRHAVTITAPQGMDVIPGR